MSEGDMGLRRKKLNKLLDRIKEITAHDDVPLSIGMVRRIIGLTVEAQGIRAPIGSRCIIDSIAAGKIDAEIIGFSSGATYLMPLDDMSGIEPEAPVLPQKSSHQLPVGPELLGRVVDSRGRALDGRGRLHASTTRRLDSDPINPILRKPIREALDVGVRVINGLFQVGRGQRIGLFSGSGVGKSVLLGMMTRHTAADITVVALIGERGREVKDFIENILGQEGMKRAIVVACPADTSPLSRIHGAMYATSIAEHFRDQGKNVLLLMDSLTRYAQAQREIGLAAGEPPATKGYPPSVFAKLPKLVERAGTSSTSNGSITAFYTVLAEGDDQQDPIADAARAILDGHIVLSREMADEGVYPAVNVESSISRVMPDIASKEHMEALRKFKSLYSYFNKHRDLISIGAYRPGNDPKLDQAVAIYPRLRNFIQQSIDESVNMDASIRGLYEVLADGG